MKNFRNINRNEIKRFLSRKTGIHFGNLDHASQLIVLNLLILPLVLFMNNRQKDSYSLKPCPDIDIRFDGKFYQT